MKITNHIKKGAGPSTRVGPIGSSFEFDSEGRTYFVFLGLSKGSGLLGTCSNYRDPLGRALSEAALKELLQEYWDNNLEEGVEDLYDL